MGVETIHIENRRKIKNIILKFPELMEKNAIESIKNEYYRILSKEDELYETRDKVRRLESEIESLRRDFNLKSNLFDIEFETSTKEIENSKCRVMVEGHGNSTLGITSLK